MLRSAAPIGIATIALILGCTTDQTNSSTSNGAIGVAPPSNPGTITDIRWSDRIEVASGNAHRGPWRMNRSEWDFVDDSTVAMNDHGFVGVAWADHPKQDILFQLYDPDDQPLLDEPVNISRSSSIFSWLPRVILTNDDDHESINVYVLWQEIVFSGGSHGGEIFFARSTDGGQSFSEPANLSNTTAGAGKGRLTSRAWHNGSLDIVRGPQGNLYAAWTEYEGRLWFSRSTDDGETFSDPLHVAGSDDVDPARGPTLAVNENGDIFLAWTVGEDRGADIRFAVSGDDGETFSEPRIVHESDGHADAPKMAVDSEGTIHLVYAESPRGPGQRYHIRCTTASDESHTFDEPREIISASAAGADGVNFPMLRLDGQDNIYLTWEHYPSVRGRPGGLGFAYSTDGGETFSEPQRVPDSAGPGFNGSQQGFLMSKLGVNEHGEIAVVNCTFDRGESSHIWLIRGNAESGG